MINTRGIMKNKLVLIINLIFAIISLIISITIGVIYINQKTLANALWYVLVSGIILLLACNLFYEMKIIHQITVFGCLVPIAILISYLITFANYPDNGYQALYVFSIPQILIFACIFGLEIYYYIKKYKHIENEAN